MNPPNPTPNEQKNVSELTHLEAELRTTLEQNARLQNALADANMRILAMQNMQQPSSGITGAEVYRSLISELDQPLTTINGFCDILLLESVGILGSLQRKFIERIQHAAQNMHIMIDDLSRYAGREITHGQVSTDSINLIEICNSALNTLSALFLEKQITLALDMDDTIPSITADRQDIEQVIHLILLNAVQAAPDEGFVQLSIKSDPDARNKSIIMNVFNSGTGIKEIDITRIFTSVVPDTENQVSGLGISQKEFSILKMLIEELDSSLNVISDPNEGTSFILKIPLKMA
ncbi:HAMP domain-containing histidine kinase [bacterium]|nr:HAMP domain-containing histidine kinase [bacterium]